MADQQRELLSVEEAIRRLTSNLPLMTAERVPLKQALGRVLAEAVNAPHSLPPFAHSAMDGYAVRSEDIQAASEKTPIQLQVIGESAAGQIPSDQLAQGQAVRITTGAPIPIGADCVIPVEQTDRPEPMGGTKLAAVVRVQAAVESGGYIRPAGLDVAEGERLLPSGHRLRSQDIGLLGAVGLSSPSLRRQPRVALLSTGDEVVGIDDELKPGAIRDANGAMIAAVLEGMGAVPLPLGIAQDSRQSVQEHLAAAVDQQADLLLSTAGVSMGAHDYVRLVVEEQGELAFWKVNVRPGRPLAFGNFRGVPFLGLPGNPVSAWVTANLFLRPAVQAMLGQRLSQPLIIRARLKEAIKSDGRESYLRAVIRATQDGYQAQLTGSQDSAVLSSLVKANGLLIVPAGVQGLEAGEEVEVWLMHQYGLAEVIGQGE